MLFGRKRIFRYMTAGLALVFVLSQPLHIFAAYKDVPSSYWAYGSITKITNMGLMAGNASGYYKPDDLMDKFETSKILAAAAGYTYTNATAPQKAYFDAAYDKNKTLLAQYNRAYEKWNSTADREIAFLLEKQILTLDDLNGFIVKSSGTEKLRALTREECAKFMVRLIGKEDTAISGQYPYTFKDDAKISLEDKPYVYYLKAQGVVSGDTNGNFNPGGGITRATMAVLLDKTLSLSGAPVPTASTNSGVTKVETISGSIDKLFGSINAVQILSADNQKNIYKVSATANITVDGYLKTFSDLKEGMPTVGIVTNGELTELNAQSAVASPAPTATPNIDNTAYSDTDNPQNTLVGVVKALNATAQTLTLEVRMLSPKGEITVQTNTYTVTANTRILRDDATVPFSDITKDETATVTLAAAGNTAAFIQLEPKERKISDGTLIEKRRLEATGAPVLVIQDIKHKNYEFYVTGDSSIYRKDLKSATWEDLRIGDSIDVYVKFNNIVELNAYGIRSTKDGWIENINISKDSASILLRDTSGAKITYPLILKTVDPYSLRVGSKVRLRLDSQEVESISVIESGTTNYVTGYISSINTSGSVITIRDVSGANNATREARYDINTIIINTKNGNQVNANTLAKDMKIYVVYASTSSALAKTITILD